MTDDRKLFSVSEAKVIAENAIGLFLEELERRGVYLHMPSDTPPPNVNGREREARDAAVAEVMLGIEAEAEIGDDRLAAVALRAARMLHEVLTEHDREEHDGEVCEDERINMVAFLIHRLGQPADNATWDEFLRRVKSRGLDYQANHDEHAEHES